MKCERCGASMLEEQIAVSGGLVKLKNVSAWHCTECERVEYGTMRTYLPQYTRPHDRIYQFSATASVRVSAY